MYKELISELREEAEWARGNEWKVPIMLSNHLTQAADAIEDLIVALTASNEVIANSKPRWIPVEERLPEEWKSVLALVKLFDDSEPNIRVVAWYTGFGKWRVSWDNNILDHPVTHWTPLLPEPPKEET